MPDLPAESAATGCTEVCDEVVTAFVDNFADLPARISNSAEMLVGPDSWGVFEGQMDVSGGRHAGDRHYEGEGSRMRL